MRIRIYLVLFLTTVFVVGCTSVNSPLSLIDLASQPQSKQRQILVNFAETQHKILKPVGPPGTSYRIRQGPAQWKASPRVRKLKSGVEEDYNLEATDEWPIEILGLFCVVYDVPTDQKIDTLIEKLAKDHRVESVQRMQVFGSLAERYNNP